jgi:iron complex transport system substrate-binding protein
VSLAPSITATLYALGLGDRVVGVICAKGCAEGDSPIFADTKIGTVPNTKIGTVPDYPPEVKDMARVGDLFDPNYEAILALKPDLVIALEEQSPSVQALSRLKVETLVVDHKTIEGIVESFGVIGRVCGKGQEGRRLEKDWGK